MTSVRVLSVCSELFPLIKTGGLADVTGALPAALAPHGIAMRPLLPGYPGVLTMLSDVETAYHFADLFGGDARLLVATGPLGLALFVLDAPHLYDRPGNPYTSPDGQDWPDNAQRFAALSWVAKELALGLLPGWRPDIMHGHDWQAGLAFAYLAFADRPRPATILTVHNLAYQGQFPATLLDELKLPHQAFALDGLEYYGAINFLKAGLFFSDGITTVSPTYAREIQSETAGMGLQGLLRARADVLTGIVNGIDEATWNSTTDPYLAMRYTVEQLDGRSHNKAALQTRLDLDKDLAAPLFCVVSRLNWLKGIDLLPTVLPHLIALGGQLALLGVGDPALERDLAQIAAAHPGKISCVFRHDESLAHQFQGAADSILIPSRFEPCGLTQLHGLRYGNIPVVARVGGLADTVIDANDAALADGVATGFQFAPVTVEALEDALSRTVGLFRDKAKWRSLQRRGMTRNVGWPRAAGRYASLYADLLAMRRHLRDLESGARGLAR
jgi:starch synthase